MLLSLVGLKRFRDARSRHTASAARLGVEADRLNSIAASPRFGEDFDDTFRRIVGALGK